LIEASIKPALNNNLQRLAEYSIFRIWVHQYRPLTERVLDLTTLNSIEKTRVKYGHLVTKWEEFGLTEYPTLAENSLSVFMSTCAHSILSDCNSVSELEQLLKVRDAQYSPELWEKLQAVTEEELFSGTQRFQ